MKAYLKRYLPEILVVVVFALISFVYFMPADMDGRILYREDSQAGRGAGMEINHEGKPYLLLKESEILAVEE